MFNRSFGARALQVASSLTLCTFAIASQADPISLEAVCNLSTIQAGQARCDLAYSLADDFTTPGDARKSQIKINGILVHQFVNDNVNPVAFSVPTFGVTTVACGASYTVTAYIARLGASTTYEKVGSLRPVVCPAAP